MDLDREDMMEAVTEGVRQAFSAAATSDGLFDRPHELLYDAVRGGIADAIWRIATNATQAPCEDFYDMIREGVEAGMARFQPSTPSVS